MNYSEFNHQIKNYLESDLEGALLINGKWGSGKTYYMTETLPDLLPNKKIPFFISLNGVSSIQDLQSRIVSTITSTISGDLSSYISGITKTGNFLSSLPFFKNYLPNQISFMGDLANWVIRNNKENVFCFDDLERSSPDTLKNSLGYIQDLFIEKLKTKVIFIVNEAEIHDASDYFRIKEKSILFSLYFKPQIEAYFTSYTSKLTQKTSYSSYLLDNKDMIISIFNHFKLDNIRTLQFFLFHIENILNIDSKNTSQYLTEARLTSFFFVSMLYREGLILTQEEFTNFQTDYFAKSIAGASEKTSDTEIMTREERRDQFLRKYESFSLLSNIDPLFIDQIFSGITSEKTIKAFFKAEKNNLPEEIILLQQLQNPFNLEESEFRKITAKVIKFAKNGKYPPMSYIRIYYTLNSLREAGLKLFKIEKYLVAGLIKSGELIGDKNIDFDMIFFDNYDKNDQTIQKMVTILREIKEKSDRVQILIDVEKLFKDPCLSTIESKTNYNRLSSHDIFLPENKESILNAIKSFSPANIECLTKIIKDRYLRISNIGEFRFQEVQQLEFIKAKLSQFIINLNPKQTLLRFSLSHLITTLNNACIHLTNTKK